jgi:uncharacterized membrane protein YbjE (DUF340 family)
MKFFIINSFRFIVFLAYFAIIALYALGAYIQRAQVGDWFFQLTGSKLQESGQTGLAIVVGLVAGWFAATIICGVLVTLLDIRDDINDRLPNARAK